MTTNDIDAIRKRGEGRVSALCDEIEQLRAKLADADLIIASMRLAIDEADEAEADR